MDESTIVYRKTVNGQEFAITAGHVLANAEVAASILAHGIHRAANSARTNAEDKDAAEAARLQNILDGEMWRQGGGNALDGRQRLYREHLASWAEAHLSMKRTEAAKAARQNEADLLAKVAKAILKRKGESTGSERVEQATAKLEARILKDVDAALSMDADI